MKRVEIKALFAEPERYTAEPVTICGWVRTLRSSKALNYDEISRQNVGAAPTFVRASIGLYRVTPRNPSEKITGGRAPTPDCPRRKQHGVPAHHPAPASPHQYL